MNKAAFVYRWRNTLTKEWYVGYHCGTADDGYICSSDVAKPRILNETGQWQRRILRWGDPMDMLQLERRILTRLNARDNARSLNRNNGNGRPPSLHRDLNISELQKSNNIQIADMLLTETNPERRFLLHRFVVGLSRKQNQKKP
jgi:hypothetical protein